MKSFDLEMYKMKKIGETLMNMRAYNYVNKTINVTSVNSITNATTVA